MFTVREVRNPIKRKRAEKIIAALGQQGDVASYDVAGAISPSDGLALLDPSEAAMAMTLVDTTTGPGDTIRIEMMSQDDDGVNTAVLTPNLMDGGSTITFSEVGHYVVLVWVVTIGWKVKAGTAAVA
jgi:hypothetical protein